jgi:predicted TIM-barrel enzyme
MPYGDANQIVEDMAGEVLPVVMDVPVLAGVCGTDPFRVMRILLSRFKAMGFSGVQNFPTVGLCDGIFRANLEATGMSYQLEVDMIAEARSQDLLTAAYVFDATQAVAMTTAGADILVAHAGLTTSGLVGAQQSMSLAEAATFVQGVRDAAASIRDDVIVICHGGPIATPADAEEVIGATHGVVGFFGASSVERLPTEEAITGVVQRFKEIRRRENDGDSD